VCWWLCVVQVYKLPAERLYATYFGGDASQGLPADDEAKGIWLRFLPEERVLPFGCKVRFRLGLLLSGTAYSTAVYLCSAQHSGVRQSNQLHVPT
jgi:hypothetical protein